MNNILSTIILGVFIIGISDLQNEVLAKEITNIQWEKSVAIGKKLKKFR